VERFTFDQVASVYSKARPDYPDALVDDVVSYARGFPILATDPGSETLRGARESLANFSNVEFLETTFEAWPHRPSGVPADHCRAVLALGVLGGAVQESCGGAFA
jgi:hypothetical protein